MEATATGRWPREWDSNVFTQIGTLNNAGTDLHELTAIYGPSQYSVSGTDPLILTIHTIVALAD